ncbi:MAG: LytTR family transcriptional regulator DNA-binding domain-containing protein [Bacteroidales bacterium]|nr:LytTR family transcriptional regulator DNA-binding domain-containing protein [Bacteroidales bacterium]
MYDYFNRPYPFNNDLKFNLKSFLGIITGLFIFLLFFLPLDPPVSDFNKKVLILSGFAMITFFLLALFRVIMPILKSNFFKSEKWTVKKEMLLHFFFLVFNTVAYTFFARYVGLIEISFHLVVNIVLISLGVIVVFIIINEYRFLRKRLYSLMNQNRKEEISDIDIAVDTGIEFESNDGSERFLLFPEQIILIKSADNYIEIIFKQNDKVSRRLLRSTLKKAELTVTKFPFLIRCHRSFIVNADCIHTVHKTGDGLILELTDYPHMVKVSRQYIIKVKEALNKPF